MTSRSEFTFELLVCAWAEREWPPESSSTSSSVFVARQLGTQRRRWDTLVLECDPDGLRERAKFGRKRLDGDLLHVIQNAPADWRYYREALPHPGYPWRYVRESIHRAVERGILEMQKRRNRIEIRRKWAYPDWLRRIVAIENKPDLTASAARALTPQLEHDVALALADEVWVATLGTGERFEPVLFEDLPVEVGLLTLDYASFERDGSDSFADADYAPIEDVDHDLLETTVHWYPRSLAVGEPGTRILERPDGGDGGASASRFEYVDPDCKEVIRLEIAERAYERGWRSYVESMRPDCRYFELRSKAGETFLPWCSALDRSQRARECSGSCSAFEPEPPAWRTRGWPIEGGPGKAVQDLLETQRERRRPGL